MKPLLTHLDEGRLAIAALPTWLKVIVVVMPILFTGCLVLGYCTVAFEGMRLQEILRIGKTLPDGGRELHELMKLGQSQGQYLIWLMYCSLIGGTAGIFLVSFMSLRKISPSV